MSIRTVIVLAVVPAGMFLGLACGAGRGGEPAAFPRQVLRAPRMAAPLTIDGDAADWPRTATPVTMALDPDADQYRGTARVAWDAQFLYVLFEVASGKPLRNAGDDPATCFKTGDTVEVFLSVNERPLAERAARGPGLDTARPGDYKILMTLLPQHPAHRLRTGLRQSGGGQESAGV